MGVLAALKNARIWDEHRRYDGTDRGGPLNQYRKSELSEHSAHIRTDPAQIAGMRSRSKSRRLARRRPTNDNLRLAGRLPGERFDMRFLRLPEAFPVGPTTGLPTGPY